MDRPEPDVRAVIRPVQPDDAERLLELKLALDSETNFMMLEPGERAQDAGDVAREITAVLESPNSALLVADTGKPLAGYVEARGGEFRRNRHSATIIAGVRRAFAGQGIGSQLFEALLAWAEGAGMVRLELTVMAQNAAAIGLYEKFGFGREGLRRKSLLVDGVWVDEVSMARIQPGVFAGRGGSG